MLYRQAVLGKALLSALDKLETSELIPHHLKSQIMDEYDKIVLEALQKSWISQHDPPAKLVGEIKQGLLHSYRNVENLWTFDLKRATFKGNAFIPAKTARKGAQFIVQNVRVIAGNADFIKDLKMPETTKPPANLLGKRKFEHNGDDAADKPLPVVAERVAPAALPPVPLLPSKNDESVRNGIDEDDFEEDSDGDEASTPLMHAGSGPVEDAAIVPCATAMPTRDENTFAEDDDFEEGDDSDDEELGGGIVAKNVLPPGDTIDEEELNSADDSDGQHELEYQNIVVAQFTNLKRVKNKWILKLTAGMATLNGKGYAFTDCNSEWEFV